MKLKIISFIIIGLLIVSCLLPNVFSASIKNTNVSSDFDERIFDLKMKFFMKIGVSPSMSACIVKNGSVVWAKAYGHSNAYLRKKATTDTIYLLSSNSKPVIATALLQLYDKGLFDLDDNVSEYLPFDLKNPNYPDVNITFRMLLSHRASIYDVILYEDKLDSLKSNWPIPKDFYPWIKDILVPGGNSYDPKVWYNHLPGTKACYSSLGYVVISYLVERISNQSVEDYCQQNIFEPLDMKNTSYHPENLDEKNMAMPYFKHLGIYIPISHLDYGCLAGMGGLRTTTMDLSHFLIAHMNNGTYNEVRILKNETIKIMHNTTYPEEGVLSFYDYKYGLGWFSTSTFLNERVEGHGGCGPGAISNMHMNLSKDKGIIVFFNKQNLFYVNLLGSFMSFRDTMARWKIVNLLLEKADEY